MAQAAPELVAVEGVNTDTAASLMIAAGDNPERLKSEAAFANLCGVAPTLRLPPARRSAIDSTARATAMLTGPFTSSLSAV